MSKNWTPKPLLFKEAEIVSGLHLIDSDLDHIVACCDLLLESGLPLDPFQKPEVRALLCSAVITYRRCFNSRRGARLGKKQLKSLSDELREKHDFFVHLGNMHLAHSLNDFEQCWLTVHVAEDEDGKLHRSRPSPQSKRTYETSIGNISTLRQLAEAVQNDVVGPRIKKLMEKVESKFDAMSDDEIRNLPQGFLPEPTQDGVGQERKWPPGDENSRPILTPSPE